MAQYGPEFWGTWKGYVIKAIAVDGAKTWDEIHNFTGIPANSLNKALSELYDLDILHKRRDDTYWIDPEIGREYRKFFEGQKGPRIEPTSRIKPLQVFVSYAFPDKEIVEAICKELEKFRIKTYLAVHDQRPGNLLGQKIERAIEESDAILVLMTKNSASSPSVNQEVAFAKAKEISIIPLVEKGAEMGVLLQGLEYIKFDSKKIRRICGKIVTYLNRLRGKAVNKDKRFHTNVLIDETKVIEPDEYEPYDFDLVSGEVLNIEISSDYPINLYIFDQRNFKRFERNRDFDYEGQENVTRWNGVFECARTGKWSIVLDNTEGEECAEVDIKVTRYTD